MDRVYLKCTIRAGAFSGERTFTIAIADGSEWEGTASVQYFRRSNRKDRLEADEPAFGNSMDGYVEGRVRHRADGLMIVEVPSSDLAWVSEQLAVAI